MRKKKIEDLIEEETDIDLDYSEIRNKIDFSRYEKPESSLIKILIPLAAIAAVFVLSFSFFNLFPPSFGQKPTQTHQNGAAFNRDSDNGISLPIKDEDYTFELREEMFEELGSIETALIFFTDRDGVRKVFIIAVNGDSIELDGEVRFYDERLKQTSLSDFSDRETVYVAFSSSDRFKVVYVFKKK